MCCPSFQGQASAKKIVIRVPVTKGALAQRLRRALTKDGERLLANRGGHDLAHVGRYYIVDGRNLMKYHDVDLEAVERELGVMRSWEHLIDEE